MHANQNGIVICVYSGKQQQALEVCVAFGLTVDYGRTNQHLLSDLGGLARLASIVGSVASVNRNAAASSGSFVPPNPRRPGW